MDSGLSLGMWVDEEGRKLGKGKGKEGGEGEGEKGKSHYKQIRRDDDRVNQLRIKSMQPIELLATSNTCPSLLVFNY